MCPRALAEIGHGMHLWTPFPRGTNEAGSPASLGPLQGPSYACVFPVGTVRTRRLQRSASNAPRTLRAVTIRAPRGALAAAWQVPFPSSFQPVPCPLSLVPGPAPLSLSPGSVLPLAPPHVRFPHRPPPSQPAQAAPGPQRPDLTGV